MSTPWTYSELRFRGFVLLHGLLGRESVLTADHLHESMAFVGVDDACLYLTKLREKASQIMLGSSDTPNEQSTAQNCARLACEAVHEGTGDCYL